ncbi:MAG: FkbM family methyltransferase [Chloroflexi bacterium]|nr:FkbM family methyltransferase [Chloroflexota bacterium]
MSNFYPTKWKTRISQMALTAVRPLLRRFPNAVLFYRYLREGYPIFAKPKPTLLGFRLAGDVRMETGSYEKMEVGIVEKCLDNVEVFVNIGANIGYYCCLALGKSKPTVAFEPLDANLKLLYKNVAANGWHDQIEIFPIALSNRVGLIELFGGHTGASLIEGWAGTPEHHRRLVPRSTLDTVLGDRFRGARCLVLVDIEGAEYAMLQGAVRFLAQSPKPIWMIEIQGAEHQPSSVGFNPDFLNTFHTFWSNGYDGWTVEPTPRLVIRDEVEAVWTTRQNTLPVHNFIFVEANTTPPHI